MCGIAGTIAVKTGEETIGRMLKTMGRRGPDGSGIYRNRDAVLLHTRLAVIDPAGGAQPMVLDHGGQRYVMVYNGELYNTEELRRELEGKGHRFSGLSDTEVLLHAFAQFGEGCLEKLNGIYAFAVWAEGEARLFLARDRMGVKPLFYTQTGSGLLFASEMKTILAHPETRARLDADGARQLLLLGPGRLPGSGVFRDILELEPGCCGWFSAGEMKRRRYWNLVDREHTDSFEETVETVRFLVSDAICRQLVSDVPVGAFLSGGLDSSLICAVCAGQLREQGKVLPTFSVDYDGNDRNFQANAFQPDSDGPYILQMQHHLHTCHHRTVLTAQELVQALEEATEARDLPGMADVDFSLLVFCGEVRKQVTVALSGECADEIFGGYPWYRDNQQSTGFPWARNTAQRLRLLRPELGRDGEEFIWEAWEKTCRESDILPGRTEQEVRHKQLVNLNVRWFMQTLLDRKDRMSMYHSLEVRVPFCDHRIAQYMYGVPWEMKQYQGREKGLLRYALGDLLPEGVRNRKKSPYPKTFDPVYRKLVEERFLQLLEMDSPLWHVVSLEEARKLPSAEGEYPWYGQLMRTPQILAYFLQMDHWLKHYHIELCF